MLAALYMAVGRYEDALSQLEGYSGAKERFDTAVDLIGSLGLGPLIRGTIGNLFDPLTQGYKFQRGHLWTEVGHYEDAKAALDDLIADESFHFVGPLYWAALYDLGRIAEHQGKSDDAIDFYSRAVNEIERQRSTINTEGDRIGFFGDKQTAYQALVRLLVQKNRGEEAFLYTERAKARALVDMLASKQDFAVTDSDKARELLALQYSSDNLLTMAHSLPEDIQQAIAASGGDSKEGKVVSSVLATSRSIRASIAQEISALSPELSSLVSVATIGMPEIRGTMSPNETLVSYFYDEKNLYAFVVTTNTVKAMLLDRKGLENEIEAFRKALHDRNSNILISQDQPSIESLAGGQQESVKGEHISKALYRRLIAPVEAEFPANKIIIAPHGALHYLPFSALSDGSKYLIDRYQLNFIPSASALKYIGTHPTEGKSGTLLALGNPDLGNSKYDLAFAEIEAKSVGAIFSDSAVLVREKASKKNVKEYGSGFKYLHFATHGEFFPDNPLGSALMLAGNSATEESSRLTVSELYSMKLNADLVTLSACQTALGRIANGDDVVGLVRGFLYAGANSVIATLWEIDDEATSTLMVSFYKKLKAGILKAQALREAQIDLRASYPHPYFWAAFQMTGGR